ncbi:MAG: tetratricopeptide repeat protein [Akkermansiaceae bacterium]
MSRIIIIFLSLWTTCLAAVEQGNQSIFDEANQLFEQANVQALVNPSKSQDLYQESILKYQYLIDERGLHTAELHANLGNAYFSAEEHGWAVLHYQRALDLDPLQEDVLHNLRYARSLTIDELPATRSQQIRHVLSFWHRWPFAMRAVCFGFAHAALWGLGALLFYRKIGKRRWIYWSMASAATLSIIFGLSLLASHQRWDNPVDAVIVEREVVARLGNGLIYANAFESPLHAGTEFSVLEQRGDWYYAKLLNGDTCWLQRDHVQLVNEWL